MVLIELRLNPIHIVASSTVHYSASLNMIVPLMVLLASVAAAAAAGVDGLKFTFDEDPGSWRSTQRATPATAKTPPTNR